METFSLSDGYVYVLPNAETFSEKGSYAIPCFALIIRTLSPSPFQNAEKCDPRCSLYRRHQCFVCFLRFGGDSGEISAFADCNTRSSSIANDDANANFHAETKTNAQANATTSRANSYARPCSTRASSP